MFKMGCSKAKKILSLDSKSQQAAGEAMTKKGQKPDKQPQQQQCSPSVSSKKPTGDELNDFSKLQEDPRIPLNVRQIFKITKSWKAIARTMSRTGTAMFLNLFEQNQDLFYLFDRFQHLKGDELHESMELREHAATVMSTLDQSINSLSDYDNFVTYLHSIGELHRKVPGFRRAHFWKIEQPFLKAVKQTLDERCNETIEEIYKIAIKLIIETIAEGYGEDFQEANLSESNEKPDSNGDGNNTGSGGGTTGSGNQQQQQSASSRTPASGQRTSGTSDNLKNSSHASSQRSNEMASEPSRALDNLECRSTLEEVEEEAGSRLSETQKIKLPSTFSLSTHSSSSSSAASVSSTTLPSVTAGRCTMMQSTKLASNMLASNRKPTVVGQKSQTAVLRGNCSRSAMQLKRSLFVLRQLLSSSSKLLVTAKQAPLNTGKHLDDDDDDEEEEEEEASNEEEGKRKEGEKEAAERVGATSGRLINCPARYGHHCGAGSHAKGMPASGRQLTGSKQLNGCPNQRLLVLHQKTLGAGQGNATRASAACYHSSFSSLPTPSSTTWKAPMERSCNSNEPPAQETNETLAHEELAGWPKRQLSRPTGSCMELVEGLASLPLGYAAADAQPTLGAGHWRPQDEHSRLLGVWHAPDDRQMCGCSRIRRQQQREADGAELSGTREGWASRAHSNHHKPSPSPSTQVKQSPRGYSILMSLQRLAGPQRRSQVKKQQQQEHQQRGFLHTCNKSSTIRMDMGDVSELIKELMQALSLAQRDLRAPLPVA